MRYAIALLFAAIVSPAFADATSAAGACYSISDPDARIACLAKAHRDPARCYAITDQGKRSVCVAEVKGK